MSEVIDKPKLKTRSVQRDYDPINPSAVLYYLRDLRYPASKESILCCANQNNAPAEILQIVNTIAALQYRNEIQIMRMIARLR